jgi:hypothetical protein
MFLANNLRFVGKLAVVALLLGTGACAPAATEPPTSSSTPTVEAIATRRAADAEVRRISAGLPDPTATAEPTPAPRPTCPDAIWWYEARTRIGEAHPVEGPVVQTRRLADGRALLAIGQLYPDPTSFAVLIPGTAAPRFASKTVCVTGRITSMEGSPAIEVADPASILVLN